MAPKLPLHACMRMLVTGGSGVVGRGVVQELLRRGHEVVLLARHATREAREWPSGVIARDADVADETTLRGTADGCDVVLHLVGIVREEPPAQTFARINVRGTQHMLAETRRAGIDRFVYASSLNAERGASDYHRSKRIAEEAVREFDGNWTIVRPGNVYGPGDGQISMLLQFVRGVTPIVPLIGDGDQPFQPIWWTDCARAFANVAERSDLAGRALDIAGTEVTSQRQVFEMLGEITQRNVVTLPMPGIAVAAAARVVSLVGWKLSISEDQVQMVEEGNVIAAGGQNALTEVLGITPTPLADGLRALTEEQPEQLPDDGVGPLVRKRFHADIASSQHSAEKLFSLFCERFGDVTPSFVGVGPEEDAKTSLENGESLTLALPMRGHVQVRVTEMEPRGATLVTLSGHPLAGAVRFTAEPNGEGVRFQVEVYERAANLIDLVAMRSLGDRLQDHTWTHLVERVVEVSGGEARNGVAREEESLSDGDAAKVREWLANLVVQRKREENAEAVNG